MGAFDEYSALRFKYPRAMNFWMMNVGMFAIMFFGKGIEKLSMQGHQTTYETARRARRFYVPYFLASYKWRFPLNK